MTSSTPANAAATFPTGTWNADHTHSFASFAIRAVGTFRGSFERIAATLVVGDDGSAELVGFVIAESIQVKNDQLRAHLSSSDFFDMETYPEMRFRSSSLTRDGAKVKLVGELTIRDQTQRVEGRGAICETVTALDGAVRFGLSFNAVINRTDYGVSWNLPMPTGGKVLGDEVAIAIDLDFVRADAPDEV